MHARMAMMSGLIAVVSAPAAVSANSLREAHIVRPTRGDVMVVHGGPAVRRTSLYVAPVSNWNYRGLRPGDGLPPAFYSARYVVAHPARLPAARGDRRWVRYGDDLLLMNIRNGRVVRVVEKRYD